MVVGGIPDTAKAELIDLSGQNRKCRDLPDIPLALRGMVGIYINERAIVCGGYDLKTYSYQKVGL